LTNYFKNDILNNILKDGNLTMAQVFEAIMVVCFGLSWPLSILKSLRAKTAKGKSILFLSFIIIGYAFGIISKFISGNITYVLVFYIINMLMVSFDAVLYFRNKRLDAQRDKETK